MSDTMAVMLARLLLIGGAACSAHAGSHEPTSVAVDPRGPAAMLAIVERVCVACHHEGGNVPYVFRDGAMLRRVSQTAALALRSGSMPPWLPTQSPTDFLNVPSLTEEERKNLSEWFALGAEGSESWKAPPTALAPEPESVTLRFGDGWATPAEPDLLFARTFLQKIAPSFPLRFRGFSYRPFEAGALEMVMLNSDTTGMGRELDARDGAVGAAFHADLGSIPAGTLGAAGVLPRFQLPDGYTFAIEPGCDLLAEGHARALGRSASGAFEVTILPSRTSDTTIVEPYVVGAVTTGGAPTRSGYTIEYICDTLDAPMEVLSILPNTGIRCTNYDLNLIRRTGEVEGVLNIPVYRAWADRAYVRRTPLVVFPGDRFHLRVSHADGFAFLHTHASAVMLVVPHVGANSAVGTAPVPATAPAPASTLTINDPIAMISIDGKFRLARNETSIAEFSRLMKRVPSAADPQDTRDSNVDRTLTDIPPSVDGAIPIDTELPCVGISFYDALEYCNALSRKVGLPSFYELTDVKRTSDGAITSAVVTSHAGPGYRLPTEAEWEFAASCDESPAADQWCIREGEPAPAAPRRASVGVANKFGIVNLGGNVWEWCEDGFTSPRLPSAAAASPSNRGRIVKGGSFADSQAACTPKYRSGLMPSARGALFGFRVARD